MYNEVKFCWKFFSGQKSNFETPYGTDQSCRQANQALELVSWNLGPRKLGCGFRWTPHLPTAITKVKSLTGIAPARNLQSATLCFPVISNGSCHYKKKNYVEELPFGAINDPCHTKTGYLCLGHIKRRLGWHQPSQSQVAGPLQSHGGFAWATVGLEAIPACLLQ